MATFHFTSYKLQANRRPTSYQLPATSLSIASCIALTLFTSCSSMQERQRRALEGVQGIQEQVEGVMEVGEGIVRDAKETVEEVDRRVKKVGEGVSKMKEGAELIKEGVGE